jgi:hypothetical protein
MSLVIGIKSCARDLRAGFHEAIRQTWGQIYHPVMFFTGNGTYENLKPDEVVLDAPDDYKSLPRKTKKMMSWFLDAPQTHMFLCDNDTFIYEPEFLKLDYEPYDYAGKISLWPKGATVGTTFHYNDGLGNTYDPCWPWASGGYGYFVSKKAAEAVVETEPCSWAEDLWVGQVLGPLNQAGQMSIKDAPYHNLATYHFNKATGPFTVDKIYQAFKNGKPSGREWSAP